MHVSHTLRFLALFGALSMIAASLPADAQYYNGYRTPRQWRHHYRANRQLGAVMFRGDAMSRINEAYARGVLTPQEFTGFQAHYQSAIINDQRFGGTIHMDGLHQTLDKLFYERGFRF